MNRDENLLFAILAVQLNRITPEHMAGVAAAWEADPSRDLPVRLGEAGLLTAEDRDLLMAFVRQALEAHDNNGALAIESFGGLGHVRKAIGLGKSFETIARESTVPGPPLAMPIPLSDDDASIPPLEEVPGRYSQISEHARGGMGRVLLVHDQHLGRDVALKELLPDTEAATVDGETPVRQSVTHITRFLREARVTGQLEHPAIVPVYELGVRRDGTLYYTMRLVRGRTLARAIAEAENLQARLGLLSHFLDLCHALGYAHSRGVIHRDVKPQNVMVGEFGETVVLDWGLAKVHGREDAAEDEMRHTLEQLRLGDLGAPHTAPGRAVGTPHYMPPEQARGELDKVDERSDVYALGTVLYELLTGRAPYKGDSVAETIRQAAYGEVKPVLEIEPEAPPELVAICGRAMQLEREARYPSARELADDVRRFLSGAMVGAYSYSLAEQLRRYARRHKAVLTTAGLALVVLLAMGIYAYVRVSDERDAAVVAWKAEQAERARAEREEYRAQTVLAKAAIEAHQYAVANAALDATRPPRRGWEWGYLRRLCHLNEATLAGHGGAVQDAEFSPNGAYVATACDDGKVRIWRSGEEQPLAVVPLPGVHADLVCFTPDGRTLVAGSREGQAFLIDFPAGTVRATLDGHSNLLNDLCVCPGGDRVLTCSADGTARLWDVATGRELRVLEPEGEHLGIRTGRFSPDGKQVLLGLSAAPLAKAEVYDAASGKLLLALDASGPLPRGLADPVTLVSEVVAYSPDGNVILTASSVAKLWDARSGRLLAELGTHRRPLTCAAFSPDGRHVATGGYDGSAEVADARTGAFVAALEGHRGPVYDIRYSPDGQRVLTASDDGTAAVWDPATGARRAILAGHGKKVGRASFSPDGRRVLTASWDGTAKLWRAEGADTPELAVLRGHESGVYGVAFSPDGRTLATASDDGTARLWEVPAGAPRAVLKGHAGPVLQVLFLPDGKRLLTASDDGTARLWDASDGRELAMLAGHKAAVLRVALSPDGRRAATASKDGTAKVWDLQSGTELLSLVGHADALRFIDYSPGGARIVTASHDGTAKVWNAETGAELFTLEGHRNRLNVARFSPDGSRIVTAARDGTAKLWNADTGTLLFTLVTHGKDVADGQTNDASFSPDGARVVTASNDWTVRIWEVASGRELAVFANHTMLPSRVAFSPDGTRVVTAGGDGTARLFDVETGSELAVLSAHTAELTVAALSPDGRFIATSSWDNTARLWGDGAASRVTATRLP